MVEGIKNITIIYEHDVGDLNIDAKDLINLIEAKSEKGYGRIYDKLTIEFYINKEANSYESNSLLFHENKIDRIIINYSKKPTVSFSLPKYIKDKSDSFGFDYDLKVLETTNGKLHLLLEVNCTLSKEVIAIKEEDVRIIDENDENKPRYYSISSLTTSCLIFKNKNKLSVKKINLRLLDSAYVVGSRRVELMMSNGIYKPSNDNDVLFLNNFFGEDYGDYPTYLEKIQKSLMLEIRKTVANRGCNLACIHCYKYRVNEPEDMFNILVEYLCCKTDH